MVQPATESRTLLPGRANGRPGALAVAASAGVLVVVLLLREAGLLVSWWALVVGALALVSIPTSTHLSGRLLLNGTIAFGWVQVLWWVRVPIDRPGLVLAVVVAGAAGCAVHARLRSGAWPLPEVGVFDVLPVATLVSGLALAWHRLVRSAPQDVLVALLPGWDNAAHYEMVAHTARGGATLDVLRAPPGGTWSYASYPEAFHATAASLAGIAWPDAFSSPRTGLAAFDRSSALLTVAAVTILVAGLMSFARARGRWDVAVPLAVLVAAAYLVGLGRAYAAFGFDPFLVATALCGCGLLVAVSSEGEPWCRALAFGGAVAGVAHGWLPLLSLLLPGALVVLLDTLGAGHPRSRRFVVAVLVIVAVSAWTVWRAVRITTSNAVPVGDALGARGDIPPLQPLVLLGVLLVPVVVLAAPSRSAPVPTRVVRRRAWLLSLAAPLSLVVAVALAVLQVRATGHLGYYFYKYVAGAALVVLVVACCAVLARASGRAPCNGTRLGVVAGLSAVAVAMAVVVTPRPVPALRDYLASTRPERPALAHQLLCAASGAPTDGLTLLGGPAVTDGSNLAAWYLALRGEWTTAAGLRAAAVAGSHDDLPAMAAVSRTWRTRHDGALLVSPAVERQLAGDRVVAWRPQSSPSEKADSRSCWE